MKGRMLDVACTVEIADTPEEFHAHVVLDGIEVGPGDAVIVHDAPTGVDYGQRIVCDRRATVSRAGWLARFWTRLTSRFELTMLYEVSFSPDRLCGRNNLTLLRASPVPAEQPVKTEAGSAKRRSLYLVKHARRNP